MYEIFAILPKVKSIRTDLVKRYGAAQESIQVASAVEGAIAVRSVAYTVSSPPQVTLKEHNIMGVRVPKINATSVRHTISERGYGLVGTSPQSTTPSGATRPSWSNSSWRRNSRPPSSASWTRSRRRSVASTLGIQVLPNWTKSRSSSRSA